MGDGRPDPIDLRRLWAPDPPPLGAARTVPVPPGSTEHAFVAACFRESLPATLLGEVLRVESPGQLEAFEARARAAAAAAGEDWNAGRGVQWLFHGTSAAAAERIAGGPVAGFSVTAPPGQPCNGVTWLGRGPHFDATAAGAARRAGQDSDLLGAWPGLGVGLAAAAAFTALFGPGPARPVILILSAVVVGRTAAAAREATAGAGVDGAESVVDCGDAPSVFVVPVRPGPVPSPLIMV